MGSSSSSDTQTTSTSTTTIYGDVGLTGNDAIELGAIMAAINHDLSSAAQETSQDILSATLQGSVAMGAIAAQSADAMGQRLSAVSSQIIGATQESVKIASDLVETVAETADSTGRVLKYGLAFAAIAGLIIIFRKG